MSEVERIDDSRARFSMRVWIPIITRAFAHRNAVAGLIGGGVVVAGIETVLPLLVGRIVDEARAGSEASLLPLLLLYLTLFVVFAVGVWVFILGAGIVATRTADQLRRDCFAKLQSLEPAYFDVRPTGWLVSRLTSDCSKVAGILPWCILDFAWCSAILIGVIGTMFLTDARLALWALAAVPVMILVSAIFQRYLVRSGREARRVERPSRWSVPLAAARAPSFRWPRVSMNRARDASRLMAWTTAIDRSRGSPNKSASCRKSRISSRERCARTFATDDSRPATTTSRTPRAACARTSSSSHSNTDTKRKLAKAANASPRDSDSWWHSRERCCVIHKSW